MSTLSDSSQDNLGWVYPLPPQTEITATEAFVGVISGVTALTEDQDYVDVTFGTEQPTEDWVLLETGVLNIVDVTPLNLMSGIVTEKTVNGFRVQLNGLPDSGNYFLSWSIRGAFGYYFSGPSSGTVGVASSAFTVRLPDESTMTGTAVITPSDGGIGGTFAPTTVELTLEEPSATFTYTASTYGARSISVTNDRGLINPAQIGYAIATPTYALTGPSGGGIGVESTDFTVTLSGTVIGTVTVTPDDSSDGTFTPTTVALTTLAPSDTFTYTPASSGTKAISVTNDGGLIDPASLDYLAAFSPSGIAGLKLWLKADSMALADGTAVGTWADQSGLGNDATQATSGAKPLFKTNRINGLPALQFDGTDDCLATGSIPGPVTTTGSVFIVQRKNANSATLAMVSLTDLTHGSPPANSFSIFLPFSDFNVYFDLGDTTATGRISGAWGGDFTNFFAWSFVAGGGNMAVYRNGTSVVSTGGHTNSFNPAGLLLGINGFSTAVQNADIAEILIYSTALGTSDRQDVENYLLDKYGL